MGSEPHAVFDKPDAMKPETDNELALISPDLSVGLFHDTVLQAFEVYVVPISQFAPVNARGTAMYHHATELLRERLSAMGWKVENYGEVPSISDPHRKVRIVCRTCSDSSTGLECQNGPQIKDVGKGTLRLAGSQGSVTLPLPGFECLAGDNEMHRLDDYDFYYLLIHIDRKNQEIRLELSSPFFSNRGVHQRWKSRLLLPAVSLAHEVGVNVAPAPVPDIKVSFKTA